MLNDAAPIGPSCMIDKADVATSGQAVDYLIRRFMSVAPDDATRKRLTDFLTKELGTANIAEARTYMEQPLRLTLHLIMSQPEYQLN